MAKLMIHTPMCRSRPSSKVVTGLLETAFPTQKDAYVAQPVEQRSDQASRRMARVHSEHEAQHDASHDLHANRENHHAAGGRRRGRAHPSGTSPTVRSRPLITAFHVSIK